MRLNAHSIRSSMFRALAAFCGVNLLVALPLAFVIFECIPHRVELAVVEDGHVAIAVSDSRQGDGSVNFCASAELYDIETVNGSEHLFGGDFPCAFDFSAPAFLLRSDDVSNVEIAGLQIIVGDVLCRTLSPEDIASVYSVDGTNLLAVADNGRVGIPLIGGVCRLVPVAHPSWSVWRFSPQGRVLGFADAVGFASAEMLLLVAVLFVAFVRRAAVPSGVFMRQTIMTTVIAVFFFFYVVPLQSYLVNEADYPFGMAKLLWDILPYSVVAFVVVVAGLLLSEVVFGRVLHFVLFAFMVYEYLEVGVLSWGTPLFLGDLSYYSDFGLIQRDWMVFVYTFTVVLVPYVRLKKYFPWMLASFFVMGVASLFDAGIGRRAADPDAGALSSLACSREQVPYMVKYSSRRNIVVFVLDSVTVEAAQDVVQMCRSLADCFDGFHAFGNNLGGQYQTDLSTVCIFTGEYYKGNASRSRVNAFLPKACQQGSLLHDYLASPFLLFCMVPRCVFGHGYASGCVGNAMEWSDCRDIGNSFVWRQHEVLATSVLHLSLFRLTPFDFKHSMFRWIWPFFGCAEESYVYPQLLEAPVLDDVEGVFLYCHTTGAHVPHDVSTDGVRHGALLSSYKDNVNHVKAVFAELEKILKSFKEKGIYDCSTILVMADHGSHIDADAKRVDTRENALPIVAFPMLWVKPANSHGPIVFDETTPTTHANLHKVLRALKDRDLTADEIAAMLRADTRTFIRQTRDGYDEWTVGKDGSVLSKVHREVK